MTPLQQIIYNEIQLKKYITIERYMELALYHPEFGYYMKKDPFGMRGDFTTSPEISQMFGEIIGAWIVDAWVQLGSPIPFQIIECGAGRGTLMKDLYSVIRKIPELLNNTQLTIVECSTVLIQKQRSLLEGLSVQWHASFDQIKKNASVIIGNEFFDALPISQFILQNGCWAERCVVWNDTTNNLTFDYISTAHKPILLTEAQLKHGVIYEVSELQKGFMFEMCDFIKNNDGAILLFDYGYQYGHGDTLQALSKHKFADVLSNVGENDITSHVNFGFLQDLVVAKDLKCSKIQTQGNFLKECGIEQRTSQLVSYIQNSNLDHKEALILDIEMAKSRLIDRDQMGELFKVMAVASKSDFNFIGF